MPVYRTCCECEMEFEIPTAIDMGFIDPDDPHDILPLNESLVCDDCDDGYYDDFLFNFL